MSGEVSASTTRETQAEKEARWKRQDENQRYGMRMGNPMASLCLHCYGRHWSPKDDECPHPKFVRKPQGGSNGG